MKYQQVNPEEKNKYEENIISFIDDLDDKIAEFENEIKEVEKSSRENLQNEIRRIKEKRIQLEEKLTAIKEVGVEKWALISSEVDGELKDMSKEINKLYEGLKSGLKHMVGKLER